jgi:hypothetical protein
MDVFYSFSFNAGRLIVKPDKAKSYAPAALGSAWKPRSSISRFLPK